MLTDNEIIKALECRKEDVVCAVCNGRETTIVTNGLVLSLINRQKAEIESLNNEIDKLLKQIPTADAVEVVRCKDCKYSKITHGSIAGEKIRVCMYPCIPCGVKDTHYCGYGERKGGNND